MDNSIIARMQSFREWFKDYSDNFIIIGGAACSLIMEQESTDFRLTKDVDVVLLVEALTPDFGNRLWDYVREAGYEHLQASTGEPQFYRFVSPKSTRYPEMIELFPGVSTGWSYRLTQLLRRYQLGRIYQAFRQYC